MKINKSAIMKQIKKEFMKECAARNSPASEEFTHFFIHILARDASLGMQWSCFTACAVDRFLQNALTLYFDPVHPVMNIIKLKYCHMNYKNLTLDEVRKSYEEDFQQKLQKIVKNLMQYPETSNENHLKEVRRKMLIYIVAAYDIGDPENHVLLKKAEASLSCVLGPQDLQSYVGKKRYHRLEYLQRLAATVGGMLIFNSFDPDSDREHIRDLMGELLMAKQHTKTALEDAYVDIRKCIKKSVTTTDSLMKFDYKAEMVQCQWPLKKIRVLNKFTVLFHLYQDLLEALLKNCVHTIEQIDLTMTKTNCVMERIKDVLKYRNAVDSEIVFPHFKYLNELWVSMVIYVRYLIELNKTKDAMEKFVNEDLKNKFRAIIAGIHNRRKVSIKPTDIPFLYIPSDDIREAAPGCSLKPLQKDQLKKYCAATIALTNGILVLSTVEKKLCEDSPLILGFRSMELAKLTEYNFFKLKDNLIRVIYTSASLIVILNLENIILQQDAEEICDCFHCVCSMKSISTQTEMIEAKVPTGADRINTSSNIWDFHRLNIALTNAKRMQTKSPQTDISFGKCNVKLQAFKYPVTK